MHGKIDVGSELDQAPHDLHVPAQGSNHQGSCPILITFVHTGVESIYEDEDDFDKIKASSAHKWHGGRDAYTL
jgi:hypothetical protein